MTPRILSLAGALLLALPLGALESVPGPAAADEAGLVAAAGKVFLTPEEALDLAFPGCTIEREKVLLSKEQAEGVEKLGKVELESRYVFRYSAKKDEDLVGTAYFDTHRVRTMRETLMIVVDSEHRLGRIEVLAFAEPEDYLPRGEFYAQFAGKRIEDDLELKRGVKNVAGATMTARATAAAARRTLAVHEVLARGEA